MKHVNFLLVRAIENSNAMFPRNEAFIYFLRSRANRKSMMRFA